MTTPDRTGPYIIGIGNAVMDIIAPTEKRGWEPWASPRASCSWSTGSGRNT